MKFKNDHCFALSMAHHVFCNIFHSNWIPEVYEFPIFNACSLYLLYFVGLYILLLAAYWNLFFVTLMYILYAPLHFMFI